jgi:hypothetical protein
MQLGAAWRFIAPAGQWSLAAAGARGAGPPGYPRGRAGPGRAADDCLSYMQLDDASESVHNITLLGRPWNYLYVIKAADHVT